MNINLDSLRRKFLNEAKKKSDNLSLEVPSSGIVLGGNQGNQQTADKKIEFSRGRHARPLTPNEQTLVDAGQDTASNLRNVRSILKNNARTKAETAGENFDEDKFHQNREDYLGKKIRWTIGLSDDERKLVDSGLYTPTQLRDLDTSARSRARKNAERAGKDFDEDEWRQNREDYLGRKISRMGLLDDEKK